MSIYDVRIHYEIGIMRYLVEKKKNLKCIVVMLRKQIYNILKRIAIILYTKASPGANNLMNQDCRKLILMRMCFKTSKKLRFTSAFKAQIQ